MINPFGFAILKHLRIVEAILSLIRFVSNNWDHNIGLSILLDLFQWMITSPDQNSVISLKDASDVKS